MEGKVVVVTLGRGPLERGSVCVLWSYGERERWAEQGEMVVSELYQTTSLY